MGYLELTAQPASQVTPKGTLSAASSAAARTFNATESSDFTATIGENVTAVLAGFTGTRQSISLLLTVSAEATLALSGGTWSNITTQTLTSLAAGAWMVVFKSYDSGTTGGYTVTEWS